MARPRVIHWFRQDLRLSDNASLTAAASAGNVLPIYILDSSNAGEHAMGAASRWWLHYSLEQLNNSLNGHLRCYCGDPLVILKRLVEEFDCQAIYWNRCYEPWRIERDTLIKEELGQAGINVQSFNSFLLWEPWQLLKKDGTPYRVFTPFYRRGCLNALLPREPLARPEISWVEGEFNSASISELKLLPQIKWDKPLRDCWDVGEASAQKKLKIFIEQGLGDYKEGRDFPAKKNVSRLSPHLHWGEVSPNQFWYGVKASGLDDDNEDCLLSELGWREFSNSLLFYFPSLPTKNLQKKFDNFAWQHDKDALESWQKGMTGYPIVDAGMRELWQTGYMHNRVRMIVGSFLVKNLLLHWHHGQAWFWDCLVDADLASNSASWQWVAGCGADAAPYFRVFNPITQGEKFDASGEYTRKFVPELRRLPDKYLHKPWLAAENVLKESDITMGETYPWPIVDVKESRVRALEAFRGVKIDSNR